MSKKVDIPAYIDLISYLSSDEISANDETNEIPSPKPSLPESFDPRPKTRPSLLTARTWSCVPDKLTISLPESS